MNEIVNYEAKELTKEDLKTLEQCGVIPKDTPPAIVKSFARLCSEKKLSPFSNQIYLIKRGDKYNNQTGIDGYRALAERTGLFMGSEDYLFDEGLTEYKMLEAGKKQPKTATCIVNKLAPNGTTIKTTATVRWEEYYPGDKLGFMWKKMPFLMLGKCAESLALRKAFPDALGGIYTKEEMQKPELNKEDIQKMNEEINKLSVKLKEYSVFEELKNDAFGIRDESVKNGLSREIAEEMINTRILELRR